MRNRVLLAVLAIVACVQCEKTPFAKMLESEFTLFPKEARVVIGREITFVAVQGVIDDWNLWEDLGNHPTQGPVGNAPVTHYADIRVSADRQKLFFTARRVEGVKYPVSVWMGTRQILSSVDSLGQWTRVTIRERE